MKKTIKVISLLLVCIICVFCISGCGEQSDEIQIDNVVQALKNNGFSDAGIYVEENETRISLSSDEECYLTFEYVQLEYANQNRIYLKNVSIDTNLESILKSILPLYGVDLSKINMTTIINDMFVDRQYIYSESKVKELMASIPETVVAYTYEIIFSEDGYKEICIFNYENLSK